MSEQNQPAIEYQTPFSFSLKADENGVTELTFVKNVAPLFSTIFFTLDYINGTFDVPYPTLGDFLRQLATSADEIDSLVIAKKESQSNAGTESATQVEQ